MPEIEQIVGDKGQIETVLGQLSHSDLVKIAGGIKETERRKAEEGIRFYVPYDDPGYQLDFHKSKAGIRIIDGGNKSGKTHPSVAEDIWWATGTHPYLETPKPPVYLRWVATDLEEGIKKVALEKFKEMVRRDSLLGGSWDTAYSKESKVLHYANGSFEEFMTYKQEVEDFGGTDRHKIHFDEPPPQDIYNENLPRLLRYNGKLTMSFTPVNLDARTSWLYDYFLEALEKPDEMATFQFDVRKNRSLDPEAVRKRIESYSPSERATRTTGEFPQLIGRVFPTFNRANHIIKPIPISSKMYSLYIGIDPHPREKTHVSFIAIDQYDNAYVYDELAVGGSQGEGTVTIKYIVDLIKTKIGRNTVQKITMDSSAREQNILLDGKSIWALFGDPDMNNTNKGIYAITVKFADKNVHNFISLMQSMLGLDSVYQKPKFFIFDTCPGHIKEFETCQYGDYVHKYDNPLLEKIYKKGIHYLDCVKYVLLSGAPYVKSNLLVADTYKGEYNYLNRGVRR